MDLERGSSEGSVRTPPKSSKLLLTENKPRNTKPFIPCPPSLSLSGKVRVRKAYFYMNQIGFLSLLDIYISIIYHSLCFQTGIEKPRLATVLESEAAFIFCKDLPAKNFESGFDNIDVFSLEQRYLVLNAEVKSQPTAS